MTEFPKEISEMKFTDMVSPQTVQLGKSTKPRIFNFFATWCSNCKKETAWIKKLANDFKGKVDVVGIASFENSPESTKQEIFEKNGAYYNAPYPLLLDQGSKTLASMLGIEGIPQTILVDKNGKIRRWFRGTLHEERYKKLHQATLTLVNSPALKKHEQSNAIKNAKFIDQHSKEFSFAGSLTDKIWIANFIFTSCQMECPMLMKKMQKITRHFKQNPYLHFVSVTVDPVTDTSKKLKEYQSELKIDHIKNWSLVRTDPKNTRKIMQEGFGIGSPDNPVFHTQKFVLMNGMHLLGYYDADNQRQMRNLVTKITSLLSVHKISKK